MTHHQHTEWFAPQLNRLVHGAILFAIIFCVDSACLADDPPAETTEPPTETAIPSVAERWDRVMCLVEQKKEGENTRTDGGAALRASLQDIRWGQIILLLAEGQSLVACMAGARARARRTLESCWRLISRLHRAKASFIADLDLSTRADIALPVPETAG